MSRPAASRLALAALLAASLGLKALASAPEAGLDDHRRDTARLAAFLSAEGFRVAPAAVVEDRFLRAEGGGCVMLAGVLSPRGWHNEGFKAVARPGAELFYVFGGRPQPAFPRARALASYVASRALSAAGRAQPPPPVLGVAADLSCRARALPWPA